MIIYILKVNEIIVLVDSILYGSNQQKKCVTIYLFSFQFFGFDEIKKMRDMKNRRLLAAIQNCRTRHFKHWTIKKMTAGRLRQFLDQVEIIKGVKIVTLIGDSSTADKIVETLVLERAELDSVEIINSECTDTTLRLLIHNSNIKIVRLSGENIIGDYLVPPSCTTDSVIEDLNLSGCRNLSSSGIAGLLKQIGKTLKMLNLSDTSVSFSDLESLPSSFPVLEELNLSWCSSLTDAGIMGFLNKTGATLKILNLRGTEVSLSNIVSLTCNFPRLEKLNLSWCSNLTEVGIMGFLSKTGETLKTLDLSTTGVSFSNVGSLTCSFPVLSELSLLYCRNLTKVGTKAFLNKTGENLKILNISTT